jgi:Uncharacterized conserved protein
MSAKIIMFPNNYKERDVHPDFKSHSQGFTPEEDIVLKSGEKYDIAAWHNTSKTSGNPYMTVIISPFKERQPKAQEQQSDLDDSIPF